MRPSTSPPTFQPRCPVFVSLVIINGRFRLGQTIKSPRCRRGLRRSSLFCLADAGRRRSRLCQRPCQRPCRRRRQRRNYFRPKEQVTRNAATFYYHRERVTGETVYLSRQGESRRREPKASKSPRSETVDVKSTSNTRSGSDYTPLDNSPRRNSLRKPNPAARRRN